MIEKLASIPEELRNLPQWVGWRKIERDGKATKIPVDPRDGLAASSADAATWGSFTDAVDGVKDSRWDGVGFVFSAEDPYCGIDLDDCIDPATGQVDAEALAVVDRFSTYAELSPSGLGVHIILKGLPPGGLGRKRGDRECYDRGRFFTMTGDRITPHGIEERAAELAAWHAATFPTAMPDRLAPGPSKPLGISDVEIVAKIRGSIQADKFDRLWAGDETGYASRSEADLALASILAWWGKDAATVDRMFRASSLMRDKWDAPRGNSTYGAITVARAINTTDGGYDPNHNAATGAIGKAPPASAPIAAPDSGLKPDPDFATNADLRNLDLSTRWVWDRWLQTSVVNLLAAEGGLGKTRFMADLCRRVHLGMTWPDGKPTAAHEGQYLAMWVAGDRNHGELLEISERFGFGDRISYSGSKADPLGNIGLDSQTDFDALHARAKAARPLFLVIDTAGGATGRNLSKQEDARAFFAPLSDIAQRLNLCIVVITHLNAAKNVLGKRAEERVRCVVRMSAENRLPETKRRVEVVKSNGLFPEPLGMTLRDVGAEYDNEPPAAPEGFWTGDKDDPGRGPATKTRECMDWLTETLRAQPWRVSSLREEAEKRGWSAPVLYKAKEALQLIETESQGYKMWALRF